MVKEQKLYLMETSMSENGKIVKEMVKEQLLTKME